MRQYVNDDAPAMLRLRSNPDVMRYLGRPKMQNLEDALKMIEGDNERFSANNAVVWCICLQEAPDQMIGNCGFWRMDKHNHRAEIGYLLDPAFWGKGYAFEACQTAVKYCFEVLNFHSIMANTDPLNDASGHLLERLGFVQEAYFREDYYFDGQFLDSRIYSLLNPGTRNDKIEQ
jgi:[ribosomal protein S5]-alanine N-acetyltransferase